MHFVGYLYIMDLINVRKMEHIKISFILVYFLLPLLLLLLLLLLFITFMQDVSNYISETNHVSRVCNVAASLYLQFMIHVILFPISNVLYFYISTLRSMCAVPNMAVSCTSLISCCPGMFSRYDLAIVTFTPIFSGITSVFTFHVCCISTVRSLLLLF